MDLRRLIIFVLISVVVLFAWDKYFSPQQVQNNNQTAQVSNDGKSSLSPEAQNNASGPNQMTASLNNQSNSGIVSVDNGKSILVTTDVLQAKLNTLGGTLTSVSLLSHGDDDNAKQPYKLMMDSADRVFIAQTGLVDNGTTIKLPNHNSLFTVDAYNYTLMLGSNDLVVTLRYVSADNNKLQINKIYRFKRGSYLINISYQIKNDTDVPIKGMSAYWRLLRDQKTPMGESKLVRTFTGAAYYTTQDKFNKLSFSAIDKGATYPQTINNGWLGFIQHYFTTMWLLDAYNYKAVCNYPVVCRPDFQSLNNGLISAGLLTDLPTIAPHTTYAISVPLFAGPEEYKVLQNTAPDLERTKDYGWVYIFATPLFWLLVHIYQIVNNWGWAIIGLTFIVKMVLYPLTRASYISMAKMKALAPKLEQLKKQYGSDKAKLQKSMMELYRSEKVNPVGGCLPMILQIPVFLGLYWALLSSVELRQASFLWIHDLSIPDPYYILPTILAITMFLQTFLTPQSADPAQAKMMRIMPLLFSIMFFVFPAGLVLYWLINNVLSMSQQWYVNHHVTLRRKNREAKKSSYNTTSNSL